MEGEEVIHLSIADVTPDNVDQEGEDASVFIAGDGGMFVHTYIYCVQCSRVHITLY